MFKHIYSQISYFVALLLFSSFVYAGHITFVIEQLPEYHNKGERVFLAGSINGWTADNPHYEFKPNRNGELILTIPMQNIGDKIQFKLTKGSWQSVELDSNRHVIHNRTFTFHGGRYKEYLQVGHWADKVKSRGLPDTVTGDVRVFSESLKFNNEYRNVRVFLPEDYKYRKDRRYAVIYMFDGQNLFNQATASVGMEWQVDERLSVINKLDPDNGVIVVGIDSKSNCERFDEYTAWQWHAKDCGVVKGLGAFTSAFIVNDVKPFIDEKFRTLPEREHTYIGGSSLGGYMAIYTAISYQKTFSKVFGLSNAVINKYSGAYLRHYIKRLRKQQEIDFYLDIGNQEAVSQSNRSDLLIDSNRKLAQSLIDAGFDKDEVQFQVIVGGVHDELSWSKRFVSILKQLNIITQF